jgi:hypothetical protein
LFEELLELIEVAPMPASSSEATDRCRKLLKKTQSSEKALKELLVTKRRSPSDPKVVSLRSSIRDSYEEIIFLDYAFATRKDVELSLWKSAFYKPIEEYRYRIRKLTAAAPKSPDAAAQKADVCKRFRGFLAEAGGFYTGLLRKMQTEFKLEMGGLLEMGGPLSMPGSHANAVADGVSSWRGRVAPGYASCHRSLIFLGDLNRYREQHRDSTDGHDYSSAAKYYSRAVRLLPTIGNPFNQLAVLATYDEDECDALYRYCRSLCLDSPFDTARDNMRLLFEKNAQKMRRLGQNSKRDAGIARSILVRFRTRFVRLHGILHTGQGLETFGDVQNQVMNDLAYLHKGGLLDRTLALRLFATNAFSLFQLHTSFGGGHTAAGKGGSGRAEAGATAAAACACVFSLCCATFSMLVGLELKASSTPSAPGSGSGSGSGTSMLSALVVVGEWFSRDLLLLVSPDCGASFELPVWHSALASLSQLLRRAAAAAEDNSSTISSNYANAVSPAVAAASSTTIPVLEEDIELQGFLPFKLCHLSFDAQWQHASAPPPADGKGNGKGQGQNDDEMALGIRRAAMARLQLLAEDLTANRGNSAAAGDSIDNIDGSGAAAGLWFDGESVSFPADPNAVTATAAASSVAAASAAATSGQGHGRHGLRRESRLPAAAAAATEEMVIEDESYGYDYDYTSGGATHEHEEEEVEQPMDLGLGGGGPAQAPPQQQEEDQEDDDDDDMMDDEVILFAPPRAASSRAAAPVIGNGNGHGNGGSSSSGGGSLPTPGDAAAAAGAAAGVPPLLQQHRYQQQALQHGTHGGGGGYEYASAAGTHTGNNGGGGGGGGGNGVVGSDGNNNPFSAGFGGFGGFGGLTGMAGSAAGGGGGGGDADAMNDETFGDAAMGSHHHASTAGHGQGHGQGLGDGGEGSSLIDMLAAGTAELPPGFQQVQTAPAAAMPGAAGGSNGSAALLADQLLSARCASFLPSPSLPQSYAMPTH